MAAGCVPDALPWDIPLIAHQAGFQSSGMWLDTNTTWNNNALSKTKESLEKTKIQLIDIEVTWLETDDILSDNHKLIIDVGLELSAKNILVVNRHDDYDKALSQFYKMCEYAKENIRVCLEFGEFTNTKSLDSAINFITEINHPVAGILIDLMHINRSDEKLPNFGIFTSSPEITLFSIIANSESIKDFASSLEKPSLALIFSAISCLVKFFLFN